MVGGQHNKPNGLIIRLGSEAERQALLELLWHGIQRVGITALENGAVLQNRINNGEVERAQEPTTDEEPD